ncbi:MAG: hypothetical protein WCO78_02165 [Candidatus Roizmanbacteria bacterium]
MSTFFFWSSGIIGALGTLPYVWGIYKGSIKPHRVSWLIWTTLTIINFFSQYSGGARASLIFTGQSAFWCTVILVISLKKGVGGHTRFDILCIIGAVFGLILWKITDSPFLSLLINIAIDAIGCIPTIKKIFLQPRSEGLTMYLTGMFSALFGLLAEPKFSVYTLLFPTWVIAANSVIVSIGLWKRRTPQLH